MQGLLRGHEAVQLEWFFTPQREGPMLAKVLGLGLGLGLAETRPPHFGEHRAA